MMRKSPKRKVLCAQRKFAQGAIIPPSHIVTVTADVHAPPKEKNVIHSNGLNARSLLDQVAFNNIHVHRHQPFVVLERLVEPTIEPNARPAINAADLSVENNIQRQCPVPNTGQEKTTSKTSPRKRRSSVSRNCRMWLRSKFDVHIKTPESTGSEYKEDHDESDDDETPLKYLKLIPKTKIEQVSDEPTMPVEKAAAPLNASPVLNKPGTSKAAAPPNTLTVLNNPGTSKAAAPLNASLILNKPGTSKAAAPPNTLRVLNKPGTSKAVAPLNTTPVQNKPGTSKAAAPPNTSRVINKPGTRKTVAPSNTSPVLNIPETSKAAAPPNASPVLNNPGTSKAATAPPNTLCVLNKPGTSKAVAPPNTSPVLNKPGTSKAAAPPNTSRVLNNPGTSKAAALPSTSSVLNKPGTSKAAAPPNTSRVLNKPGTSKAVASPNTSTVLNNPGTSKAAAPPNASPVLNNPGTSKAAAPPNTSPVLYNPCKAEAPPNTSPVLNNPCKAEAPPNTSPVFNKPGTNIVFLDGIYTIDLTIEDNNLKEEINEAELNSEEEVNEAEFNSPQNNGREDIHFWNDSGVVPDITESRCPIENHMTLRDVYNAPAYIKDRFCHSCSNCKRLLKIDKLSKLMLIPQRPASDVYEFDAEREASDCGPSAYRKRGGNRTTEASGSSKEHCKYFDLLPPENPHYILQLRLVEIPNKENENQKIIRANLVPKSNDIQTEDICLVQHEDLVDGLIRFMTETEQTETATKPQKSLSHPKIPGTNDVQNEVAASNGNPTRPPNRQKSKPCGHKNSPSCASNSKKTRINKKTAEKDIRKRAVNNRKIKRISKLNKSTLGKPPTTPNAQNGGQESSQIQKIKVALPKSLGPGEVVEAPTFHLSEADFRIPNKENENQKIVQHEDLVDGLIRFMTETTTKPQKSLSHAKIPGTNDVQNEVAASNGNPTKPPNRQKSKPRGHKNSPSCASNSKKTRKNKKTAEKAIRKKAVNNRKIKRISKLNKSTLGKPPTTPNAQNGGQESSQIQKIKVALPKSLGPGEVVEAPTFHLSEADFRDPIAFFEKVMPFASKYGLCKVVAPESFKPTCVLSDDIKFKVANQYIARLYSRWGPAAREMTAIKAYLATQNVPFARAPLREGLELNLPKLYHIVQRNGGLKQVMEKKRWSRVAQEMKLIKGSNPEKALDQIYVKYLLPYDILSNQERQQIMKSVEKFWNKKNQKLLDWANNPLHRQKKLLGESESESSDEEDDEAEDSPEVADALLQAEDCVMQGRQMTLPSFKKVAAKALEVTFPDSSTPPTTREVETEYWRLVLLGTEHVCVNSASIDTGDGGYGFSKNKTEPEGCHPWNLKMLSKNHLNVLSSLGAVLGVTVPTFHLGMVFSTCCWHRDPHMLPWVEFMHNGPPKIWYGIPNEQSANFRKAVETLCPTSCQNKSIWLPSDITMIPPNLLREHHVSLSRVEQKPGEYIIVFPTAYSCSISTGYTESESVYFATNSWFKTMQQVFQEVRDSCEPTTFSLEQLLIALARDPTVSLSVLQQVHASLSTIVDEELRNRNQMMALGVQIRTCNQMNKRPGTWNVREQNECEICRTTLYLSMVTGVIGKKSSVCLQHAVRLLEMPKNKHLDLSVLELVIFYAEDTLLDIITEVQKRLSH